MTYDNEQLQMLTNPDSWPNWPVLPVKKYEANGNMLCGITIPPGKDGMVRIWEANLFGLETGPLKPQLEGKTVHSYASAKAALEDGWVVD